MIAAGDDARLLSALVTVTDLLLTDVETRTLLERMVQVAAMSLPDVDAASVTVRDGGRPSTLAATDEVAQRLDDAQYEGGDGPCLRALSTGDEMHVVDLPAVEWPRVAQAARETGVLTSLSLPLRNVEEWGVLNLYARNGESFADKARRADARVFARYAGTIVAAHLRFQRAFAEVRQMHEALESRAVIEQAKGMIMLRERCSVDEAFDILVRTSQHTHEKLRDIAAALVATAQQGH